MKDATTFPERVIEADAYALAPALLSRHGLGQRLLMVCDDATWLAAGQVLQEQLGDYDMTPHSLGRHPRASLAHMPALLDAAQGVDGLLAVGSGTVNDVTKYAAHALGKPYICVPTAASMNGYSSANASLEVDGHKHSFPARAPRAVLADLRVLAAAPRKMARAGLADTLCRGTVEADNFISHIVCGTPYPRAWFDTLRAHEPALMGQIDQIKEHTLPYLRLLMNALLDAGDAMHETGSSAVASQGEHMIAHTAEMMYASELRFALHGELIAVTSTTMAHLQHKLLHAVLQLRPTMVDEGKFARLFGRQLAPSLLLAFQAKQMDEQAMAQANARLSREWPEIKAELHAIMPAASSVERVFKLAGMATQSTQLGLSAECYRNAVTYAYLTRNRFTFLDFAAMVVRRSW